MATRQELFSPVNAFIQGRAAGQQYQAGQTRNALAQMELENAPREMERRNRLLDMETERAEQGLSADKAKYAYTTLRQALDSGNAKQFVLQNVPDLVSNLQKQGMDLQSMDDSQATQMLDGLARAMAGKAGIAPAAPEAFTLKPGEARYVGGKVVASQPVKPEGESGFTLSPGQTRYGPDGKPIASATPAPDTTTAQQNFARADKLRDEYNSASKDYVVVGDAYQRVLESAADPSAAGDLALIFSYMKILDPGSVVREQEFANAQNAGGVPDRVRAQYNKVLNGERLSESMRDDFITKARQIYGGQSKRHEKTVKARYEKLAKDLNVDPKYVVSDYSVQEPQQPVSADFIYVPGQGLQPSR